MQQQKKQPGLTGLLFPRIYFLTLFRYCSEDRRTWTSWRAHGGDLHCQLVLEIRALPGLHTEGAGQRLTGGDADLGEALVILSHSIRTQHRHQDVLLSVFSMTRAAYWSSGKKLKV